MATPNVTVDIADFVSGVVPASKGGYFVTLTEDVDPGQTPGATLSRQAYTSSSGIATLASVTPGDYLLQIFGLGVDARVVTIPNEAGPIDAADLTAGDSVTSAVPSEGNPLVAGENISLTQTPTGLEIASTGGGEGTGFTDTSGALSIGSTVANGASAVAFTLDAETELTTTGANILRLENAGEAVALVSHKGQVQLGKDMTADNDWAPITNGLGLLSVVNTDLDTATWNGVSLQWYDDEFSTWWAAELDTRASGPSLSIYDGNTGKGLNVRPAVADGTTPYILDTTLAHTSGNLLEVSSNGSLKAAINFEGNLILSTKTPANASASGVAGQIAWDASFIYVCTATNTWKRVAIATW
jgi:hypothetical protein